jgi:hypothetical protein
MSSVESTTPSNDFPPVIRVERAPQAPPAALPAESNDPVPFSKVLEKERELIAARRQAVDPELPKEAEVRDTLIGLALSGGGVRSASFNLGLLQAFFERGLLRHLDYLSTVSGGGYIGSYLSALLHDLGAESKVGKDNPRLRDELVENNETGAEPKRVKRFVRHGQYLYHPLTFANSYLVGLVLNALALVSGLVFVCALAAGLWRLMDKSPWSDWLLVKTRSLDLRSLDFWSIQEWNRPLLPAAVLALIWLFVWSAASLGEARTPGRWLNPERCGRYGLLAVAGMLLFGLRLLGMPWLIVDVVIGLFWLVILLGFLFRPSARAPRYWLFAAAVALFIGLAVLLATPAIDLNGPSLPEEQSNQLLLNATYTSGQTLITSSLIGLVLVGLLPFLQPKALLDSALKPTTWYQPWIFRFACAAMALGIPFLLIVCFARHNFSAQQTEKRCDLSDTDIHYLRWNAFWTKVKGEWNNELYNTPGRRIPEKPEEFSTPGGIIWATMIKQNLDKTIDDSRQSSALTTSPVPLDQQHLELRQKVIDCLNTDVIRKVTLYYRVKRFQLNWLEHEAQHHPENARLLHLVFKAQRNQLEDSINSPRQTNPKNDANDNDQEAWELNRLLLEVYYPEEIWQRNVIRRYTLLSTIYKDADKVTRLMDRDQYSRLRWIIISGVVFVLSGVFINLNRTSLHGYYRDHLGHTFLRCDSAGKMVNPPLADVECTDRGGPYHLLNATLNRLPRLGKVAMGKRDDDGPATAPFLMSRLWCGANETGYLNTKEFSNLPARFRAEKAKSLAWKRLLAFFAGKGRQDLALADAMAVSAAAFGPIYTSNLLILFVLTLLNLRLGQWFPCPGKNPLYPIPTSLTVLCELLMQPKNRSWRYLSDGAHFDSLGLAVLLDRRCKLILVSDVSTDSEAHFDALLKVVRWARTERGIQIVPLKGEGELPLKRLLPNKKKKPVPLSPEHGFTARIVYPNDADPSKPFTGYLIYLKPTLTGDEPSDLLRYGVEHPDFPNDPAANQFFEEDQFESYRQLGEHIGEKLCRELKEGEAMWDEGFNLYEWKPEDQGDPVSPEQPETSAPPGPVPQDQAVAAQS